MYSCSKCNLRKKDDWPSDNPIDDVKGYLDPCEVDFCDFFSCNGDYSVRGIKGASQYMVMRLHLNSPFLIKIRRNRAELTTNMERISDMTRTVDSLLDMHKGRFSGLPEAKIGALMDLREIKGEVTQLQKKIKKRLEEIKKPFEKPDVYF
jgi:hypothetical protein